MRTKNRTNEIYELVAGRKVSNHPEVDAMKFKNALELKLYGKPSKYAKYETLNFGLTDEQVTLKNLFSQPVM